MALASFSRRVSSHFKRRRRLLLELLEDAWGSMAQLSRRALGSTGSVMRKSRPSFRLGFEPMEERRLLATDLGNIVEDAFLRVINDAPGDVNAAFDFELDRGAVVIASLSDLRKENVFEAVSASLNITEMDENNERVFLAREGYGEGGGPEARIGLGPGRYKVEIFGDNVAFFDLALHADKAVGELAAGSTNLSASTGRELGTLSTASGFNHLDYVGTRALEPDGATVDDQIDMYFFDLVQQGQVDIELQRVPPRDVVIDVTLFRDFNQDNGFARGTAEEIATATEVFDTASFARDLQPGHYGIAVTLSAPPDVPATFAGGTNYRLRTTYTVADGAGNSLGAARNAGTVGNSGVAFNDYLSPSDRFDFYRFTTVAGGPFVFNGTLSGMAPGANFELDFIRDLDGDGRIDFNEVESSDNVDNANEQLSVPYFAPGTYFVRVRRTAGEGVYTLQFSNRNNDLAGNTLTTAHGPIEPRGIKTFSDRVSSTDTVDVYKVRLNRQSAFEAQLGGMAAGTDANLSLIRDSDGDGFIDPGETLASRTTTGNASERIAGNLTAGTYFVRVVRVAGAPSYELRLISDTVGDELATARIVSPNGGGELDYLGPEDDADVYKFTLGSRRLVGVRVGCESEPVAVRLGQDGNGNGFLDPGEVLTSTTAGVGVVNLLKINLNAGTYFVILNPALQDEGTNYNVNVFNEPADGAGNTLAAARELGTLNLGRSFNDFVGDGSSDFMDDLDDFYRFTVANGPFDFRSLLNVVPTGAPQALSMQLIRDDNLNQQIDSGERLVSTSARSGFTGTVPGEFAMVLDVPGTYYLRIQRLTGQVSYNVSLSATTRDTAGNTLATATQLGELADPISTSEFVGRIDRDDFYRFAVPSAGELVASVSGAGGAVGIEVIRDADDDGVIDPGERLATSAPSHDQDVRLHGAILPAADGNYYVRVRSAGGDTAYTLDLSFSIQRPFLIAPFQIPGNAEKQIKAVQFDRGGEGIAYHDTTAGNSGNQSTVFRIPENIDVDVSTTTDTASVGRRVTNTAPGEFLEYTIVVDETGLYDFDARVSSPDTGATFHLEIDGVALSAPVAVPDTGSEDNMTTIAVASNVLLSAGPHILRLAIDTGTGVNNDFAGSFNFIAVRPASTGTFELTPAASSVAAEDRMQLSLAWTVPSLGWRVLKDVDLRLRDDAGNLIWIRFNEAANTVALYNTSTATFSSAKRIGSDIVLSNPLVNLFVKTTTRTAAGPTAPTVVLTFDLKFSAKARGHWTIEAAASDDRGHNDPFAFAGVLDVV
jgi:hypothetical protein